MSSPDGKYVRKDAIFTAHWMGSSGYGLKLGGAGNITRRVVECAACGNVQVFRKEIAGS